MTVGSALHTKGCLKANNNNPPPRGATHAGPKEAKTIGLKDFHEANPPALGTEGQHKEVLKTEQPAQQHHEQAPPEVKPKSEEKKEREAMDRHAPRHAFVDHTKEKKHQMVQEELLAADARANDILDELHEEDKRVLREKEHAADTSDKTTYGEYERHVAQKQKEVADLNKAQERKVDAPALKEMAPDGKYDEFMKVPQQRNDYTNDCLDASLNTTSKLAAGADAGAARNASLS